MNYISEQQKRNRKKLRYRLLEGIKSAVLPPFLGMIPILILTVLLIIGLSNLNLIINTRISGMIYKAVLIVVYLVFLLALLVALGTPKKWSSAENAALSAFGLKNEPEYCPILISNRQYEKGTRRLEFYSVVGDENEWQSGAKRICRALGGHLVGTVANGGKNQNDCNRIVFYSQHGARPAERGSLKDDEF